MGKRLLDQSIGAAENSISGAKLELGNASACLSATVAAAKALSDELGAVLDLLDKFDPQAATELRDNVAELLEVSALRGDSDLPSPPDDPKLWTARAIEAWAETADALTRYDEKLGGK